MPTVLVNVFLVKIFFIKIVLIDIVLLFLGEAVLNLSQGTVSEILSKPRAWHSLSVKGREPYIRMYTWFHDPGNVQKLLAWKKERDGKTKRSFLLLFSIFFFFL